MIKRVDNPPNRFSPAIVEWLDSPPETFLEIYEENAKSIVSHNQSPDVGFSHSINPYRGCFHACAYCYARPSHQYLGFGAGTDFERKIVVKVNAAELLREQFMKPAWKGEDLVFSGNTDCYQPLEARYELTRRCLSVRHEFRNPVGIITKGALVRRDLDILSDLCKVTRVQVYISIAFSDDLDSKRIEPGAPRPSTRFRAMAELAAHGIPVGVAVAPIIPGINDYQIPEILMRAKDSGASSAFMTMLRLPQEVAPVFTERLAQEFPERALKVIHGIQELREGKLNQSQFGQRMKGSGPRWQAIQFLFKHNAEKLGLLGGDRKAIVRADRVVTFRRPTSQLSLFD